MLLLDALSPAPRTLRMFLLEKGLRASSSNIGGVPQWNGSGCWAACGM